MKHRRFPRLSILDRIAVLALAALIFAPAPKANACGFRWRHPKSGHVYQSESLLRSGQFQSAYNAAREAFPGVESLDVAKAKPPKGWRNRRGFDLKLRALSVMAGATIRGEGFTNGQYWRDTALAAQRVKRIKWAVAKLRVVTKKLPYNYNIKAYLAEGLAKLGKSDDALKLLASLYKSKRLHDAQALATYARLLNEAGEIGQRDDVAKSCFQRTSSSACPVFAKSRLPI
ncbi:MAG: hypothetical protein KC503_28005 [Myxococcales bacterium]|nr:hypothetical protein [Myxococcales bacterium]